MTPGTPNVEGSAPPRPRRAEVGGLGGVAAIETPCASTSSRSEDVDAPRGAALNRVVLRKLLPCKIGHRGRHEVGDGSGEIVLKPDHHQPRSMEDTVQFLIDAV